MRACNRPHLSPQQQLLQKPQHGRAMHSLATIGGNRGRTARVMATATRSSFSSSTSLSSLVAPLPPRPRSRRRHHQRPLPLLLAPRAAGAEPSGGGGGVGTVFEGAYGPWTLESSDVLEVRLYRGALLAAALAFAGVVAGGGLVLVSPPPPEPLASLPQPLFELPDAVVNALAATSALGLGAALALVHVYVTPLKRLLQVLWLAGCAGAVAVAASHGVVGGDAASSASSSSSSSISIAEAIAADPGSIWLVGPAAAAATGLSFKEGLCYGKPEAVALFFGIPALCLFHLFAPALGIPLDAVVFPLERLGAVAVASLALAFAFGKLSQPEADDVGDKSVFVFRKLSPEQQTRVLDEVRRRAAFGSIDVGGGGSGSRSSSGSSGSSSSGDDDEY